MIKCTLFFCVSIYFSSYFVLYLILCLFFALYLDLEQQCRSQSEHLHELSKELLNFHLQSDTVDIYKINSTSVSQIPLSPDRKLPQVIAGFEAQRERGESATLLRNKKCSYIFYFVNFIFTSVSIVIISSSIDGSGSNTSSSVFILVNDDCMLIIMISLCDKCGCMYFNRESK